MWEGGGATGTALVAEDRLFGNGAVGEGEEGATDKLGALVGVGTSADCASGSTGHAGPIRGKEAGHAGRARSRSASQAHGRSVAGSAAVRCSQVVALNAPGTSPRDSALLVSVADRAQVGVAGKRAGPVARQHVGDLASDAGRSVLVVAHGAVGHVAGQAGAIGGGGRVELGDAAGADPAVASARRTLGRAFGEGARAPRHEGVPGQTAAAGARVVGRASLAPFHLASHACVPAQLEPVGTVGAGAGTRVKLAVGDVSGDRDAQSACTHRHPRRACLAEVGGHAGCAAGDAAAHYHCGLRQ